MKARILFLLFFLSSVITSFSQVTPEFKIGMFTGGYDGRFYNNDTYSRIWQLGINQWIKYSYSFDTGGPEGGFFDDVDDYKDNMNALITALMVTYQYDLIMQREKINRPAYGQQSDYQAEVNPYADTPGYGWTVHSPLGQSYQETLPGGEVVNGLYFGNPDNIERTILSGLYENGEQTNVPGEGALKEYGWNHTYYLSDNKSTNPVHDWKWYILPRMRIDPNDINPNDPQTVIKIKIRAYNGSYLVNNTIEILTTRFLDQNGQYGGEYKDIFEGVTQSVKGYDLNQGNSTLSDGRSTDPLGSQLDYEVVWSGKVKVWLDRVRVEDEWAYFLFNDPQGTQSDFKFLQRIHDEATQIGPGKDYLFYQDEFQYNMIPCQAEVNRIIRLPGNKPQSGLVSLVNAWWLFRSSGLRNPCKDFLDYVNKVQPPMLMVSAYPFDDFVKLPPNINKPLEAVYPGTHYYDRTTTSNAVYNESFPYGLQAVLDYDHTIPSECCDELDLPAHLERIKKAAESVKNTNIPFHFNAQVHAFEGGFIDAFECRPFVSREPTNEEIRLMTNLALCYGAKQISYWWYPSFRADENYDYFNWGMTEEITTGTPLIREYNYYGQRKGDGLTQINSNLTTLMGLMTEFTFQDGYSVHLDGANHSYIHGILSVDPRIYGQNSSCVNDAPEYVWVDCPDVTYWEMGFFELTNSLPKDKSKYFMMVNRRCTPNLNNNGDIRALRIKFNPNLLLNYNTWKICDVLHPEVVITFDKNYTGYIYLGSTTGSVGYFEPGEGKLFKLVPVPQSGGTLLADEVIPNGENFTCEDTVWTNGHDLTIEDGVTINFSDSAKFVVNGGTFQMGNAQHSGPNTINIDGESGSWKGFEFDTCNVKIYGVNFSGLANDSIAMLTMIDCPVIDLRSNSFSLGSNNNVGAIDINYSGSYGSSITDNVYIANNTFLNSSAVLPYVKVMAYSGITTPVIVEGNNFTGTSTALFLNNIQGGAIKSNLFTGFGTAVTALSSSLDIYDNTITSTGTYGIQALEGTELKMSYAGGLLVGGRNNITNSGSGSDNIYLENSYFLMDEGENIFDIGTSSYHLNGWFPDSYNGEYRERENCFKVQGSVVDPPLHYVTLGEQGNQITDFVFTPYLTGCTQGGEGDVMVINLGNGIYDTIMYEGQGGPGGVGQRHAFDLHNPKSIYDSISISMRYRNYANVKTLCLQLLNSYPDSVQSLGAVSKLYLAVSKTDTTTQGITDLKTLYENLILNYSDNISLVKRCNYYVQKCKVLLHQYSSALSGFQQIINQNPASYEGLIARWDYMATSLLMQGQGGSEYGVFQPGWNSINTVDAIQNKSDKFNDDKFSKEERKQIKQAVTTALELSKSTEQKRREVLTELSTRGDVKAAKQLKVLKSLEQTVKVEKPKNIVEHMKIVASDIQKVFVNPNAGKNASTIFIPQVFHLSQNYPNPFNPTTKINYDIPQNSIVKLTIYDILGREVIKLVNNEFKQPGRYVVEFNGTNLASGVYFYRIEASDFTDSKKMVLIK